MIHDVDAPNGTTLLAALRDDLGLIGAKLGCGHGACGACTVLVDGVARPSRTVALVEAVGNEIVTIEGLARDRDLHPVQRAIIEEDAMQCGYCTSGMILSAVALLRRNPNPSDDDIVTSLAPHLCRCVCERSQRRILRHRRAGIRPHGGGNCQCDLRRDEEAASAYASAL